MTTPELFWIKVALWVLGGGVITFLGVCGFMFTMILNHKEKIAALEGQVIDKGKERLAAAETKVAGHEGTFKEIREILRELTQKMDRLIEARGQ